MHQLKNDANVLVILVVAEVFQDGFIVELAGNVIFEVSLVKAH